jgi:hypothetical protein
MKLRLFFNDLSLDSSCEIITWLRSLGVIG